MNRTCGLVWGGLIWAWLAGSAFAQADDSQSGGVPPPNGVMRPVAPMPFRPAPTDADVQAWAEASGAPSFRSYNAYLARFPSGYFSDQAVAAVKTLRREPGATSIAPTDDSPLQPGWLSPNFNLCRPEYPRLARMQGADGRVRLKLRVEADGTVPWAEVTETSGFDLLDRATINAFRSCRLTLSQGPDGRPVTGYFAVIYAWVLQE